jgi:hypothetical protein
MQYRISKANFKQYYKTFLESDGENASSRFRRRTKIGLGKSRVVSLSSNPRERGIVLTGGGALLAGLDRRLHEETGMPIVVAKNPLQCVAIGSGQCLEEFDALQQVLITSSR